MCSEPTWWTPSAKPADDLVGRLTCHVSKDKVSCGSSTASRTTDRLLMPGSALGSQNVLGLGGRGRDAQVQHGASVAER